MELCFPNAAAAKTNKCDAFHLTPLSLAVQLLKAIAIADSASDGDGLNLAYFPKYIEVHRRAWRSEFSSSNTRLQRRGQSLGGSNELPEANATDFMQLC